MKFGIIDTGIVNHEGSIKKITSQNWFNTRTRTLFERFVFIVCGFTFSLHRNYANLVSNNQQLHYNVTYNVGPTYGYTF